MDKVVSIRVSVEEYEKLSEKAAGQPLSSFMKAKSLNSTELDPEWEEFSSSLDTTWVLDTLQAKTRTKNKAVWARTLTEFLLNGHVIVSGETLVTDGGHEFNPYKGWLIQQNEYGLKEPTFSESRGVVGIGIESPDGRRSTFLKEGDKWYDYFVKE